MKPDAQAKLDALRADYQTVVGRPFNHFYCPILYRDEDVPLCRGHIINSAFRGSSKRWTIQREDVDVFYGAMLEGDFVTVQERGKHSPLEVLTDKTLARQLRPKLVVDGKEVEHYIADGPVPAQFSEFVVEHGRERIRLAVKLEPNETLAAMDANWEIHIEKDLRVSALGSLLKVAHLTLFNMLGYLYALSEGGRFVGRTILGDFFTANVGLPKTTVLENARIHFGKYVNMVRPVEGAAALEGSLTRGLLYLCLSSDGPWAMLVHVKTGDSLQAVLVPLFEDAERGAKFVRFLDGAISHVEVTPACHRQGRWEVSPNSKIHRWPAADLS